MPDWSGIVRMAAIESTFVAYRADGVCPSCKNRNRPEIDLPE